MHSMFVVNNVVDDIFRSFIMFLFIVSCLYKHLFTG